MVKQSKKFYSKSFKERALAAYHNSNESLLLISERLGVNRYTLHSWVYHQKNISASEKINKLAVLKSTVVNKENMSAEAMLKFIEELECQLSTEKMRSDSLSKMIDIAERDLKIDIRKKSGAKQSLK